MSQQLKYYGSTTSFQNLYSNNLGGSNEFVSVDDNDAFSFGTGDGGTDSPFSIGMFIKRGGTGSGSLFCKGNAVGNQEYFFEMITNQLYLWLIANGSSGNGFIGRRSTVNIPNDGAWHYVGASYSGSKASSGVTVWMDDAQIDTTNFAGGTYNGMANGTSPVRMGVSNDGLTRPYTGRIAHPVILNKVLSAAEWAELRANKMNDLSSTSLSGNLISAWYYPNGQADYPTLTDYINGRNGTMTNQENTDINTDVPT